MLTLVGKEVELDSNFMHGVEHQGTDIEQAHQVPSRLTSWPYQAREEVRTQKMKGSLLIKLNSR